MSIATNKLPIIFILGRERSGTSLLQLFFDNHSQIIAPTESPFIRHLYKKYHATARWTSDRLQAFVKDLKEEPYLITWKINWEKLSNELLSQTETTTFTALCKIVFAYSPSAMGKNDVRLISDKNPQYCLFVKELLTTFPEAKFIFITRDYRDQVNSMLNVNFEAKIVASLAYRWKYIHSTVLQYQRLYPERFYLLKYEELIQDVEKHLKAICQFLPIAYEPGMLKSQERAQFYTENKTLVSDHHQTLQSPIQKEAKEKWKKEMKDFHVRQCDQIMGTVGKKLGYEKKYNRFSIMVFIASIPGIIYGWAYFVFLSTLNALPFHTRRWVNRRFIYPNFPFWKEVQSSKFKA
jgi:hypothetical protein